MSKRITKKGKNWSVDIVADNWMIFVAGVLVGLLVGKL